MNVPKVLAHGRAPNPMRPTPGRAPSARRVRAQRARRSALVAALSVAAFILGFAAWNDPAVLFGIAYRAGRVLQADAAQRDGGAVRRAFPLCHRGAGMGVRAFWRDIGDPVGTLTDAGALWQAMSDAGELRYLDGGGVGCYQRRRAADRPRAGSITTSPSTASRSASPRPRVATLYHYLLGTRGALSVVGPAGRARHARRHRPPRSGRSACSSRSGGAIPCWSTKPRYGMDVAFIVDAVPDQPHRPAAAGAARDAGDGRCCSRCISAWCSRCSSPCPTASSSTASIASPRWCATRRSGRRWRAGSALAYPRHCEERSDAAIHLAAYADGWIAASLRLLAMTRRGLQIHHDVIALDRHRDRLGDIGSLHHVRSRLDLTG